MTTLQDVQALRDGEQRRYQAMVQGDLATLDILVADELTWTHTNGQCDTKAQFLAKLVSGYYRFAAIAADTLDVRVYGAVAVLTGRGHMDVEVQGRPVALRFRLTVVYRKAASHWQLVAVHHTRLPQGEYAPGWRGGG